MAWSESFGSMGIGKTGSTEGARPITIRARSTASCGDRGPRPPERRSAVTSTAPDQAVPEDAAHPAPSDAVAQPGAPERSAPHQAIYRAWRAQTFAGIVGQEATVAALRNAVRAGRVAHALLFVAPRGTGKTSMARIVAKALNCTDLRDGEPCDRCIACVAIRDGTSLDVA